MEEEKLLRILNLIITLSIMLIGTCNANEMYKWAADLSDSAVNNIWEHLNAKFNEQEQPEESKINNTYSSKLYVFVSFSMSMPLLKAYAQEALRYDATLVFKGLPNGSFKELARLIVQLKDDKGNVANASIDDEAFELFSVSSVPTVVLTEEPVYHPNQTPHINFDKMTGNVGIKYALEQFENSGEIKEVAQKILEGAKHD